MKIDEKLLQKLEKLSALQIKDGQRKEMIAQLSEIVAFVENLNELNLDSEEATFTTVKGGTPMREDTPNIKKEIIETILKHAPKSENGYFVVPKIIE